jgi:hypothetical protein
MTTSTKSVQSLFVQGYRVRAGKCPGDLAIKSPAGAVYTVNPTIKTCTCPGAAFPSPCKHVAGAADLVREELADRQRGGDTWGNRINRVEPMFRLMVRWHQILDEQGVEVVRSNRDDAQDMRICGRNMLDEVRSLRIESRGGEQHYVDCAQYRAVADTIESYYSHLAK